MTSPKRRPMSEILQSIPISWYEDRSEGPLSVRESTAAWVSLPGPVLDHPTFRLSPPSPEVPETPPSSWTIAAPSWVAPVSPAILRAHANTTWISFSSERGLSSGKQNLTQSMESISSVDTAQGQQEEANNQKQSPQPKVENEENKQNTRTSLIGNKSSPFTSRFLTAVPSKSASSPAPKLGKIRVPALAIDEMRSLPNLPIETSSNKSKPAISPISSPREGRAGFWRTAVASISPRKQEEQQYQPHPQSYQLHQLQQLKLGKKKLVRTRSLSSLNKQSPEAPLEWVSHKLLNCTNTLISLGKEAKTNAMTVMAFHPGRQNSEKDCLKIDDYDSTEETAAAIVPLETFLRIRIEAQATNENQLKEVKDKKVEVEKSLVITRNEVEDLKEKLMVAEKRLQELEKQNELLTVKVASLSNRAIPKLPIPSPEQEMLVISTSSTLQNDNLISLHALINTALQSFDVNLISSILLTYPVFISPTGLLNKLKSRVTEPTSDNKESQAMNLRISSFLSFWVKNYFEDFESDNELLSSLISCIRVMESQGDVRINVSRLGNLVAKKLMKGTRREERVKSYRGMVTIRNSPENSLPLGVSSGGTKRATCELFLSRAKTGFEDSEVADVAKQLCIIEHQLFCAIKPREFLNSSWNKATKDIYAPNLTALMDWFNRFSESIMYSLTEALPNSMLTATSVPSTPSFDGTKHRVKLLEKWLAIAQAARDSNNFNAVMEVLAALDSASVRKQRTVWEQVSKKAQVTYMSLQQLMSPQANCSNYRTILQTSHPPCIPYVGVYLTDLTYLDSISYVAEDGNLRLARLQKLSNTITEILNFQTDKPYPFQS